MGNCTVVYFATDAYDQIKNNPKQVTKNILDAMNSSKPEYYSIGNHCNPMKGMPTRHDSIDAVFVQSGGTLIEMGSYCSESEKIMKQFPEFFDRLISKMERELKGLKQLKKQMK